MKTIEYQLRRCIYDNVAYTPKFVGYPTLSDITELSASLKGNIDSLLHCIIRIGAKITIGE